MRAPQICKDSELWHYASEYSHSETGLGAFWHVFDSTALKRHFNTPGKNGQTSVLVSLSNVIKNYFMELFYLVLANSCVTQS